MERGLPQASSQLTGATDNDITSLGLIHPHNKTGVHCGPSGALWGTGINEDTIFAFLEFVFLL